MSERRRPGWEFGSIAATDRDWASPEYDHLQPYIAGILTGRNWLSVAEREEEAQRERDARPYLIAHIRKSLGDPKWVPWGRVIPLRGVR